MSGLILVPLDGSSLAERALPYAVAVVRERHLRLLLVRVLESTPPRGMSLVQEPDARGDLERVAKQLREEAIEVETDISSTLLGTVPEELVGRAQKRGCELIVMSTHGRGGLGRWLYGTVAEEVMRRSPVPVLLISATCDRLWEPGKRLRVLVPLDGSPLSEEVMEPMLTSLGQLAGDVILLQVVPRTTVPTVYLSDRSDAAISGVQECLNAASRLRQRGLQVTGLTEEGSPGTVISRVAAEQDVDLVAMATHGRSGLARVVLGSVSTETVHRAHLPLLLVRPAAMRHNAGELQVPSSQRTLKHERLTVLVAIDVSEKSDAALAPTAILAQAANARVILLNVFWPPVDMGHVTAGSHEQRIEYVQRERQLYLTDKALALQGLDVTTRVEVQVHGEEVDECIARVPQKFMPTCW